jgi:hypothetical protein
MIQEVPTATGDVTEYGRMKVGLKAVEDAII